MGKEEVVFGRALSIYMYSQGGKARKGTIPIPIPIPVPFRNEGIMSTDIVVPEATPEGASQSRFAVKRKARTNIPWSRSMKIQNISTRKRNTQYVMRVE